LEKVVLNAKSTQNQTGFPAMRKRLSSPAEPAGATPARHDPRVEIALKYMEENLHLPLTVPAVASHVGIATSTFWNVWRAEMDTPPMRYLSALRVEKAAKLLVSTDVPLKVIAAAVGFPDPSKLSRTFRRRTAQAPGHYRRSSAGNPEKK
jgi:transcriptional regulator GlxA family with amidase domain